MIYFVKIPNARNLICSGTNVILTLAYFNDKIPAIKISWENFTCYCSSGSNSAVTLWLTILIYLWKILHHNFYLNQPLWRRIIGHGCNSDKVLWIIIIIRIIFHITLLRVGQLEGNHLSDPEWINNWILSPVNL